MSDSDMDYGEPRYYCPHGREVETADAACPLCAAEDVEELPDGWGLDQ